jgi:hypothetical protein
VKKGEITDAVRNLDTAATAADALGVARPAMWDGHVIPVIAR